MSQDGQTALALASTEGKANAARLLLQRGADVEAKDRVRHGFKPACKPAARGDLNRKGVPGTMQGLWSRSRKARGHPSQLHMQALNRILIPFPPARPAAFRRSMARRRLSKRQAGAVSWWPQCFFSGEATRRRRILYVSPPLAARGMRLHRDGMWWEPARLVDLFLCCSCTHSEPAGSEVFLPCSLYGRRRPGGRP